MTTQVRLLRRSAIVAAFVCATAPLGTAVAQHPMPADSAAPRRAMLEQRLRQRTAEIVQRRLGLNAAQMKQLQETNARFERQRMDLTKRERDVRFELRQQILTGDSANQSRVSQLLDSAMQIERQRLDIVQAEQRDLARFLTPVQRAKLFGLQGEMRRRTQELRNRAMQRGPMQNGRPQPRRLPPRGRGGIDQ